MITLLPIVVQAQVASRTADAQDAANMDTFAGKLVSGGQESYPLRIFTLGRSGRWTAAGRLSAGRQTADGRSSDGRPAGRQGGARVVSGAEKKII